jgi:hypothetical protein
MPISLHGSPTVVSGLGRFAYAKPGPEKEASKEGRCGDFLAELEEKSDIKPKTLEGYAAAFRKIVAGTLNNILSAKQHFERLQIAVHGLCGNLADQSLSKSYDILFRDLAHGFICSPTGETAKTCSDFPDKK